MFQIIDSESAIKIELPGMEVADLKRVNEAVIALLNTKFFLMKSGKITFFIKDGYIMKRGIYIEEKTKGCA